MPQLEPVLLPAMTDLDRGLRTLGVPFAVVGALVPELLLDVRPARMTNDADVTVVVESLPDFETLKDRLADFGFVRTRAAHRMRHHSGGLIDLLPFSPGLALEGRLELESDLVLNMAGFEHVVPSAVDVVLDSGPTLSVVPLPLDALLKLMAFSDRRTLKDLSGRVPLLRYDLEDDERRCGAEHEGANVPFESRVPICWASTADRFSAGSCLRPLKRFSIASPTPTPKSSLSLSASTGGSRSTRKTVRACSRTLGGTGERLACDGLDPSVDDISVVRAAVIVCSVFARRVVGGWPFQFRKRSTAS